MNNNKQCIYIYWKKKIEGDFFLSEEKIIKKLEGGVNVTVG